MKCFVLTLALMVNAQPPNHEWKQIPNSEQIALFKNGRQIGNFCITTQKYYPWTKAGWGQCCECPVDVPEWASDRAEKKVPPAYNFGIIESKLSLGAGQESERIEINGRPGTRADFIRAIENGVPDDSSKFRLIITGDEEFRRAIEKDWETHAIKEVKDKTAVWSVPPAHWSLHDNVTGAPMFPCAKTGKGVCLTTGQDKDGHSDIIYFEPDYRGPGDFEAIRKAIDIKEGKTYPGRSTPILAASSTPNVVGGVAALALIGGAYARRRMQK